MVASQEAARYREELDALVKMIERGDDLAPHLSRQAQRIDRRDRMLADWGIQHLHFSPQGTPDVLFAVFRDDDAYLIGIYPHQSWALKEVVGITVRNWPNASVFRRLNAVEGITSDVDDEGRARDRNAGLSASIVEVDGHVYVSNVIGQTLAGMPITEVMSVNDTMHRLRDLRQNLEERLAGYRDHAERETGRRPIAKWQPLVQDDKYGLVSDGMFFPIGTLA